MPAFMLATQCKKACVTFFKGQKFLMAFLEEAKRYFFMGRSVQVIPWNRRG